MVVCIAGSREITEYKLVCAAVDASGFRISEVVSGHARGIDSLGERWALDNAVNAKIFKADWKKHKRAAGPIRNEKMAKYLKENSGALISIWDGISTGSADMIDRAKDYGIPTFLVVPAIILV